jgi:hypothetical protein
MNRRQFAYLTAMASAVAGEMRAQGNSAKSVDAPDAAGLITEMVFLDDCARLAAYDPALSTASKHALATYTDHLHDGALSPESGTPKKPTQYALVAGRLCAQALSRNRKPDSAEARLYQDAAILRDLSAAVGCEPNAAAPVADLLRILHHRRRLAMHTLVPDDATVDDVQAWLQGICVWWRGQQHLLEAVANCYSSGNSAKTREFADAFYDPKHPLIRLARGFEMGDVRPRDAFASAIKAGGESSGYARALFDASGSLHQLPRL